MSQAMELLRTGGYTCVLVKDGQVYTSTARGVRPLLNWLETQTPLSGACAADKVVGKATAMLYCLLNVSSVYAQVISASAIAVLESHGIAVRWDTQVDFIQNRDKTGRCPMEQAVWELDDPQAGLRAVRETLKRLQA